MSFYKLHNGKAIPLTITGCKITRTNGFYWVAVCCKGEKPFEYGHDYEEREDAEALVSLLLDRPDDEDY